MPTLIFEPGGARVPCAVGESVFEIGRRAGVGIATACGAKATCGLCRIKVVAGEQHLSPFNAAERKHLGNVYFITKLRLACQTRVQDDPSADIVVELPARAAPQSPGSR
jgi:uncharacterized 2Fe-2S/4Fe-4S cluster protein (DUF4445 family)